MIKSLEIFQGFFLGILVFNKYTERNNITEWLRIIPLSQLFIVKVKV